MLSKRVLMTILILFLTVFVLFMAFTLYTNLLLVDGGVNERAAQPLEQTLTSALTQSKLSLGTLPQPSPPGEPTLNIGGAATVTPTPAPTPAPEAIQLTRRTVILGQAQDDTTSKVLAEWCTYSKYAYLFSDHLPAPEQLQGFDTLLFGSYVPGYADLPTLKSYADQGVTMVFLSLPSFAQLQAHADFADFFGIDETIDDAYQVDGAHLYGDFFLSGDRLYTNDDYFGQEDDMTLIVPYYGLRTGYDVYMTAILDRQDALGIANENMPALLWRTVTGQSQIFVSNTDLFQDEGLIGLVTAFLSHTKTDYVYPIVNAQTVNVLNFPWMTNENVEQIAGIYGHQPDSLSWDILWPGMVQILYSYDRSANFYVSAQQDYAAQAELSDRLPGYYIKQIRKLLGTMSLSLDQVSDAQLSAILDKNADFFHSALPDFTFTSVFAGEFEPDELIPYLRAQDGLLGRVSLVMSQPRAGEPLISYLTDSVLSVRTTTNGFVHEARDDMQMVSLETALGLCNQSVDISTSLYPKSDADIWNTQSIRWSSAVTYFQEFTHFDYVTLYEMEDRIRQFLALDYQVARDEGGLHIHLSGIDRESYFVVRLYQSKIKEVQGGEATQLTDTAYLIKTSGADVTILDEPLHYLPMP